MDLSRGDDGASYDHAAGTLTLRDGTVIVARRSNGSVLLPAYGGVALRAAGDADASQVNFEAMRGGVFGHSSSGSSSIWQQWHL